MLEELDAERRFTTVTATSSSPPPARARRSSPRWTTGDLREGRRPRLTLLFVAHRKEILQQSLRIYREVLSDPTFGELYVDGQRTDRVAARLRQRPVAFADQAFRRSPGALRHRGHRRVPPRRSATYRRLLDHLRPMELLGLTATPNAPTASTSASSSAAGPPPSCGSGSTGADLLCPFHYFGVARRHRP